MAIKQIGERWADCISWTVRGIQHSDSHTANLQTEKYGYQE